MAQQSTSSIVLAAFALLLLCACLLQSASAHGPEEARSLRQARSLSGSCDSWYYWFGFGDCHSESQNNRPSDRAQVICSTWCPAGYGRRDVTIGPKCSWYHWGKCVDRNAYTGEGCGYAGKRCMGDLKCLAANPKESEKAAAQQVCKLGRRALGEREEKDAKEVVVEEKAQEPPPFEMLEEDDGDGYDEFPAADRGDQDFNAHGRRLAWGWCWTFWNCSPPKKVERPAWKADSSKCPLFCRQGWWWDSNYPGKPACCQETRGGPFDNCNHERCACDAACRSCCD